MGISMGGYGAILLAEKYPETFAAVAAISPAVWTSYSEAHAANAGAYASSADFASDDVVTHTSALENVAIRVASGDEDPFHSGVEALARALPHVPSSTSQRDVTRLVLHRARTAVARILGAALRAVVVADIDGADDLVARATDAAACRCRLRR